MADAARIVPHELTLSHYYPDGIQSLVWDRRMTGGSMAPRGVYPIRVTAGDEHANGRLTVR